METYNYAGMKPEGTPFCGVGFINDHGTEVVAHVSPDSSLQGKLRPGDMVLGVREHGTETWLPLQAGKPTHGQAGTLVDLKIRSYGATTDTILTAVRKAFQNVELQSGQKILVMEPNGAEGCELMVSEADLFSLPAPMVNHSAMAAPHAEKAKS